MKKNRVTLYYGLIILVLSCQAIYTVYRLGGTAGQGEKLSHLQQQQQHLEKELQVLQEEYSEATALTQLSENTESGYQAIRQPIILSTHESVASR